MRTGNSPEGELLVGGQALIEGVMMRSPGAYGVAVRRPDGSIAFQRGKVASLARRYPFLKLPILRGVAVLFQSLALGIRALNFSAEQAMAEEAKPGEGQEAQPVAEKKDDKSNWAIAGSMAFGLVLGAVVFLLIPLWLTRLAEQHLFAGHLSTVAFNLVDGALRAAFFLAYIFAISRMKDIHRVFQYHGAEHKVVFAWEKAVPLTVENARAQSRLHPRCGTSFLLFVLLVSILVFSFIPKTLPFLVMYGGRLLLVPVIAGLSYEVLRFTAKHQAAPLFSLLVAPGLALQRITTQEPADDMLEVAIAALEEALREDGLLQDRETPREAADPLAVPLADLPPSMPGAAARA
ncbi:MAG: DUF1385 domain-containing protein [Thermoanaerobaculia bacterium]